MPRRIPRDPNDNSTPEAARTRADFIREQTDTDLTHITSGSIDPALVKGNTENFFGVAQVPMGLAGPLLIDGEHAQGHFYVPLATTEGTLVASYSRGMKLLSACGGVKTTVVERYMQRAPVFHFTDAREARAFIRWTEEHEEGIRTAAEATTSVGKLHHIQRFQVAQMAFLRLNFETGDAAGQNMAGKATLAACQWIARNHPHTPHFTLSGAIDTDKKHSHMNLMHPRGAKVVAEAVIPDRLMQEIMGPDVATMFRARLVSNVGGMLAGTVNNGMHSANGLTALFIATGQDVANIAESHAAITFVEILPGGDYYWSITIPSLIVATYGGGTGLPTQRECLEMLDCYGSGKVGKFAEICAATVLAGEVSLGAAVVHGDWVSSHDQLGRNRP